MKNENVLLEIRDLRTTFYDRDRKIEAVRGVNLKVNAGEILGIVGESGSGKSVMMRSIMGILSQNAKIDKGEIILCGSHLEKLPEREKRMIRGREIAMIFQG
ncbi:MAG TPA: peptide ABC transporter ATP-binding protein, partial [Clostridiaceae bacterium]|nr:peptide ABC transporter ATP-binding protein [Clostridiaceae bacterium]